MPEPHGHPGLHQHGGAADGPALDPLLDLDAAVLREYWSAALAWVRQAADRGPRHRLLDLGAGTGTGSIGLAQRFAGAEVIAIDVSPASLRRLCEKALDLGLAGRIRTVEADLDAGWPDVGSFDVTWASMSLHHFADPTRVLRDVLAATRPGGLIAAAELTEPLRFLPDDLGFGFPGFEARAVATLGAAHAETMPTLGSAWAPRLTDAGWTVVDEREFRHRSRPAPAPGRGSLRPGVVRPALRRFRRPPRARRPRDAGRAARRARTTRPARTNEAPPPRHPDRHAGPPPDGARLISSGTGC